MRILLISSEVTPFAKTGGLADVLAALPKALAARGHDVRVVIPHYACVRDAAPDLRLVLPEIAVHFPGRLMLGKVCQSHLPGTTVPVYLVDNPALYERPGLYGEEGKDYPDNALRFGFFSLALLWMLKGIDWAPDVLHCNDWQTGLVPLFRKTRSHFQHDPFFARSKVLYTIHNLGYLGVFSPGVLGLLDLPGRVNRADCMEYFGGISFMKSGIHFADAVSTVSEQYAREILTPEFGCGLDGFLLSLPRQPRGILNGIDYHDWDPARDPLIRRNYTIDSLEKKAECKTVLQRNLRWNPKPQAPLIGMISRMDGQKGLDLIEAALPQLIETGARFVFLGDGNPYFHDMLLKAARKHSNQVRVRVRFDPKLAHIIEAGADAFLMPSRYEPCGLNQMYSMRYGTIPIVRYTGGLADTVTPVSHESLLDGTATGFVFRDYTPEALVAAVQEAVYTYRNFHDLWHRLQENGMRQNYSWDRSAEAYEKFYQELLAS